MESKESLYDQASTIFSPDGRLFQVEYAREAIAKGETTLGMQYDKGAVLIAYKRATSNLVEVHSIEKIVQLDEHIGCATSGLLADAQHLVELARVDAQVYKITYGELIPLKTLIENICDYKQLFTQYEGVRPFGVALLIGGVDKKGARLYVTDPSGAYTEYKAVCEGKGNAKIMTHINRVYKDNITLDKAIELGLQSLQKINTSKKLDPEGLEIAIIDLKDKYYKLSTKEIKQYLSK